ncbi:cytochrome P450 302a1, mitochondrial [Arctopsyche grandis]|uniref:cytochrome P450 302a1, mitochondrial n=1 Tax=Arctopsyche grandis TaxID=121162 RepID=UPI00406D6EC7
MYDKALSMIAKCKFTCNDIRGMCTVVQDAMANQRIPGQVDDGPLKDFRDIPGPKPLPIIGNLHKYVPYFGEYSFDYLLDAAWKRYNSFGPLVKEKLVGKITILHVYDPNDIETVYRHSGKFPERSSHLAMKFYRNTKREIYGNGGVLTTNGPEWWEVRRKFQKPMSSPKSARAYLGTTDSLTSDFIDRIKRIYLQKDPIDFLHDLERLNLQLILTIAFDEKIDSFSDEEMLEDSVSSKTIKCTEYINKQMLPLDTVSNLLKYVELPLYKRVRKNLEYLEGITMSLIWKKLQIFKNMDKNQLEKEELSLLETYFANPDMNLKDVTAMSVDLILGGIDTTSFTTSFALYNIAKNPRVQEKLYKEALELLPNPQGVITDEILTKANYLKVCLKESLRTHPVSIGVGRTLTQDIALSGYRIPKGISLVTHNQVVSMLDKYFERSTEYMPERWLRGDANYRQHHPFLSIPFGHGSRMCIARRLAEQNIHITILKLVRNFKISWIGGDLGVKTVMINKPDSPLKLKFQLRD